MYWSTDFDTFLTSSAYASICLIDDVTIALKTPSLSPATNLGKLTLLTRSARVSAPSRDATPPPASRKRCPAVSPAGSGGFCELVPASAPARGVLPLTVTADGRVRPSAPATM